MKPIVVLSSLLALSAQAHAAFSTHTGVNIEKDCAVAESSETVENPEIDFLRAECAGLGGYRIFVTGGDLRYGITLGYGNKRIDLDKTMSFHDLGSDKIEWVYERVQKEVEQDGETTKQAVVNYLALIHRVNFQSMDAEGNSQNSTKLVVTKLDGKDSCTVAVVKAADDMNAKATAIAAKAQTMKCLKSDTDGE